MGLFNNLELMQTGGSWPTDLSETIQIISEAFVNTRNYHNCDTINEIY